MTDWTGSYGASTANLTFTYDGATEFLTGPAGLIMGVSSFEIISGTGNDSIHISHALSTNGQNFSPTYIVHGGDGIDSILFDSSPHAYGALIVPDNSVGFYGYIDGTVVLDHFEQLNITLGDVDGAANIFTSPMYLGAKLTLDGGSGNDFLVIHDPDRQTMMTLDASGADIKTNVPGLTLRNFEHFDIYLGNGPHNILLANGADQIVGGSGDDTLSMGGGPDTVHGGLGANSLLGGDGDDIIWAMGNDTIDGGAGNDIWIGEYYFVTADRTLVYDGSTGSGSLVSTAENVIFKNIENPQVSLGQGSVNMTLNHFNVTSGHFFGGTTSTLKATDLISTQQFTLSSAGAGNFSGYYTLDNPGDTYPDWGVFAFHDGNISWGC
jgi:Ca2+-binding RTX toxin-like protein